MPELRFSFQPHQYLEGFRACNVNFSRIKASNYQEEQRQPGRIDSGCFASASSLYHAWVAACKSIRGLAAKGKGNPSDSMTDATMN